MDIAAITHALEKIIDCQKQFPAKRKNTDVYQSWIMPSPFYCEIPSVFDEQDFFNKTTHDQIVFNKYKLQYLEPIKSLSHNWDGQGAVAPDPIVIDNSILFLSMLSMVAINHLKEDNISPTPYGTIVFDWEHNKQMLSVEIGETHIGFFSEFNDNHNLSLTSSPFNHDILPKELLAAFKKLYSHVA